MKLGKIASTNSFKEKKFFLYKHDWCGLVHV